MTNFIIEKKTTELYKQEEEKWFPRIVCLDRHNFQEINILNSVENHSIQNDEVNLCIVRKDYLGKSRIFDIKYMRIIYSPQILIGVESSRKIG